MENIIQNTIDIFNFFKNSSTNYYLYIECYKLDNVANNPAYAMDPDVNYPILLSVICKFHNIVCENRWLLIEFVIIKITYKTVYYKELKVGSIIKIRKFSYDMFKYTSIFSMFDIYYQLNPNDVCLFDDETNRECYIKTNVITLQ